MTSRLTELLHRPFEQRLREYKYRFSQSIVFGLPVLALQWYGPKLGPTDSQRWVSLFQALLSGWVLYVNLGMFFEGVLLFRNRLTGDLLVSAVAIALYLASLISALHGIATAQLWYPLLFHLVVMILAVWSAWRWWSFARRRPAESS